MAKVCTEATSLLNFCMDGSELDFPLGAGVADFGFSAGVGNMYTWSSEEATGSGFLVSWAVAMVSKPMGLG